MYKIRIKEVRETKGLTQKELAEHMQINSENISRWENMKEKPNLDRLVQMAQIMNVNLDDLVSYKAAHKKMTDEYAEAINNPDEKTKQRVAKAMMKPGK